MSVNRREFIVRVGGAVAITGLARSSDDLPVSEAHDVGAPSAGKVLHGKTWVSEMVLLDPHGRQVARKSFLPIALTPGDSVQVTYDCGSLTE